jgi:DNA replication protein DnaD
MDNEKMNKGWLLLHRRMTEWGWYKDTNTKAVWLHILLTANFEDKEWHGIPVKRGQLITSIAHLSRDLGISAQSVRTAIKHLKSTKELTISTTATYTLISINKYEDYQQPTNSPTNSQQSANKVLTTTKTIKEVNNNISIGKKPKKKKTIKKEKTYTKEKLTIKQVANKLVKHFEEENGRKSKLAPNSYNNLAYWLEVYEPNEIAEAISQIKYDSYWKDIMDLTILFRKSSKGEPVNWIDMLLNKKKENYARRR